VVLGAILAAIVLSSPAHSAPTNPDQQAFEYWAHHGSTVCAQLDHDPTVDGLVVAALNIFNHTSFNTQQVGQVVTLSVHFTCPQHQNLIDQYQASQHGRGEIA
jgi:hypothetical protein